MRITRSKGVGVFFCSQFPDDVPGVILGQTVNRIQHALPAYAPRARKTERVSARQDPKTWRQCWSEESGKECAGPCRDLRAAYEVDSKPSGSPRAPRARITRGE